MIVSKVAELRERIESERVAAHSGLSGLKYGAIKHQFITARMERMYDRLQQLHQEGKQEEVRAILLDDALWDVKGELFDGPDAESGHH
ncbi:hypothetical protein [Tengunoibacter tsumagoiensis]|uniref:Uncharacterized protein n=1 Tax=Tengunoibacter tsumagoiensis TaxID=2014871 RepID=A0A402A977_9CHLR|nr:hypothetical protein [Tengunoibacter tsumagoiensis]GCE15712.1 hypothetical protein KTT_55710 [Tengunoibacter tsumagoiensis]